MSPSQRLVWMDKYLACNFPHISLRRCFFFTQSELSSSLIGWHLPDTVWHTVSSSPLIGSSQCDDCWCRLKTKYLSLPTGRGPHISSLSWSLNVVLLSFEISWCPHCEGRCSVHLVWHYKPLPKPLTPFRHYFPSLLLGVDVVRVAPVASSVWGLRTPPSRGQQSDADGEGEQRCTIVTQTPAPPASTAIQLLSAKILFLCLINLVHSMH